MPHSELSLEQIVAMAKKDMGVDLLGVLRYLLLHLTNRFRRLIFPILYKRSVKLPGGSVYRLTARTVVKVGVFEDLACEAEATQYISERTNLPIPRVYDLFTRREGKQETSYLIMSYMPGIMLQRHWRQLTFAQHESVMRQVKDMISVLRSLPQPEPGKWIGTVSRGPFNDRLVGRNYLYGPFQTEEQFNDFRMEYFNQTPWSDIPEVVAQVADIRRRMPVDSNIVFTHGDINQRNLLIDVKGDRPEDVQITALIDWEQAGWRPAYWEKLKIRYQSGVGPQWKRWREMIEAYHQDLRRETEIALVIGGSGARPSFKWWNNGSLAGVEPASECVPAQAAVSYV
ncbi:kinase-like protein [Gymnopus androsaceus JB14]|uniref:Kinase-like protein n=1 Tax=Gymnopus androsaceus JB14 TaxID=1447944 RepID=A0A6A4HUN1_9AGAR|nr:kinase-like protein [Gymnopus androsaceus JB14]